ncbi:MAG: nickel-responsive transcriptional regulator NikR [Bacteroidetes bacterium]|nr:nickel-responsive transcriptional regulator NikR [Bacteroidota bacterium]
MQNELIRFGVSIEDALLDKFDRLINKRGYTNRSEAIRDFVRKEIVEEGLHDANAAAFGVLSFVYDHHVRELEAKLTNIQHDHYKSIISASHVHIDHDSCLEVIILRDRAEQIDKVATRILSYKGVKHGKLSLTLSGKEI